MSLAAEQRLLEAQGQARVDLANADAREPLGAFYALPLVGGVALYLAGLVLILAALIIVQTTPYGQIRRSLRGASSPAGILPFHRTVARRPTVSTTAVT